MNPGIYLALVTVIYIVIGVFNAALLQWVDNDIIQVTWVLTIALPVFVRPIGKLVGLKNSPWW